MVSPPGLNNYVVNELHQDVQNFQGGNLRYFSKNWHKYTKDTYILDIVTNGLKLELNELPCLLSAKENEVISTEIKKLLKKNIIINSTTEYNEFILSIFTKNKKDGRKRIKLTFKNFNKFVNYKHFKVESINNVLNITRPNVYMPSTDLKDAFFSVTIHSTYPKNILNLYLITCFNLHACQMDMNLL